MTDSSGDVGKGTDYDGEWAGDALDPFKSPEGHESEPDPDFFLQENEFYWAELYRRRAGYPPTELFRLEMTAELAIADLAALSKWAIANADRAQDLQFLEAGGRDDEDVLFASYESEYYSVDDPWDVANAALLILRELAPPGIAVQSSSWEIDFAGEGAEPGQSQVSAFVVKMRANAGVVDQQEFEGWLLTEIGEAQLGANRPANGLSQAGQVLRIATDSVLPRLAPPGIELRTAEWRLMQIDETTPPTWE